MRTDKSFSSRKLTKEKFSNKYWLNGIAEYQYHTVDIEDGRNEREQIIINNICALRKQIEFYKKYSIEPIRHRVEKMKFKLKIIAALTIINTAIGISILLVELLKII